MKGQWMAGLGGLVIGGALMALATQGGAAADPDKARIETIVRDYILANPEILPEAMARLEEKRTAKLIAEHRQAIFTPFAGAWAGAADADVTLVEYFDYACGYCRTSVKDVDRLLAEDKKLKIVFKELPILGEASDQAARASLSAAKQGQFLKLHRAMYQGGPLSPQKVASVTRTAGLDAARVTADGSAADVDREIETNIATARDLGMTGTPTFIVGTRLLGGAVGYDKLKAAIAEVRAGR